MFLRFPRILVQHFRFVVMFKQARRLLLSAPVVACLALASIGSLSHAQNPSPLRAHLWNAGLVRNQAKISQTTGGFTGDLDSWDFFGRACALLGDLDGDGVPDLAVGAAGDDDGNPDAGAVWILFLRNDGTVQSHQKISANAGGFTGTLDTGDGFGRTLETLSDLDGDGNPELAVGVVYDDDGGVGSEANRGAVWILHLRRDGTVRSQHKISDTSGGFSGGLMDDDEFGRAIVDLGDLDGDGILDLAIGATGDRGLGGSERGALWILFMNSNGTVRSHQRIAEGSGGFGGALDDLDRLGTSAVNLGDLDGDGVVDLATGAESDGDGGAQRGAVWILFLNSDGTVKAEQKISSLRGGFVGSLDDGDRFGYCVAALGDIDGDGFQDLTVGARHDDDGGSERGAVWILFLRSDGTVSHHQKISSAAGNFRGPLDDDDWFGTSCEALGDFDGDGRCDLVIGSRFDDDGGIDLGAVWILYLQGVRTPH